MTPEKIEPPDFSNCTIAGLQSGLRGSGYINKIAALQLTSGE
jgi:hypothetical protein